MFRIDNLNPPRPQQPENSLRGKYIPSMCLCVQSAHILASYISRTQPKCVITASNVTLKDSSRVLFVLICLYSTHYNSALLPWLNQLTEYFCLHTDKAVHQQKQLSTSGKNANLHSNLSCFCWLHKPSLTFAETVKSKKDRSKTFPCFSHLFYQSDSSQWGFTQPACSLY